MPSRLSIRPIRSMVRSGLPALLLATALVAAPASARAVDWNEVGAKTFDVCVLRVFTFAQTLAGFGLFLVAGPLSLPGNGAGEAWDIFVAVPAEETFQRPLGRF